MSRDRLTRRQHRQVLRAVKAAEAETGLQFCIYLGDVDDSEPRRSAEKLFAGAAPPAVLLVVAPGQRRVEVVTGASARLRVDDAACAGAVRTMAEQFRKGDVTGGIVAGVSQLAAVAGPGTAAKGADALADVVEAARGTGAPPGE